MMRLLQKADIVKARAQDRAREMEEGMKLSRRVDSLREIQAAEETSLERFRDESLKRITAELQLQQTALNDLRKETVVLEVKRERLLKPLTEEWRAIDLAKTELSERREILQRKEQHLSAKEREVFENVVTSNKDIDRTRDMREQVEKLLKSASTERVFSALLQRQAEAEVQKVGKLREAVEKELLARSNEIAAKERDLTLREAKLARDIAKLVKDRIKLEDRKEMFARNLKR